MDRINLMAWMIVLVGFAWLIVIAKAQAGPAKVDFNLPTEREDGSMLEYSEIDSVELHIAMRSGTKGMDGYEMVLDKGEYTVKSRAIDTDGRKSEWSEQVVTSTDVPVCTAKNIEFTSNPMHDIWVIYRKLICDHYGLGSFYPVFCAPIS